MIADPVQIGLVISWFATGLGIGLWLWGLFGAKAPIARIRFQDCAAVMVFSSILLRVIAQDRPFQIWDWIMIVLGPLFIAAALIRLARTQGVGP